MSRNKKIGLIITIAAIVMMLLKVLGLLNYSWWVASVLIWLPICIWVLWLLAMGIQWAYFYIKNWWL